MFGCTESLDFDELTRDHAVQAPSSHRMVRSSPVQSNNFGPLPSRIINTTTILHKKHPNHSKRLKCCVHLLRPPDKVDIADTRTSLSLELDFRRNPMSDRIYGECLCGEVEYSIENDFAF